MLLELQIKSFILGSIIILASCNSIQAPEINLSQTQVNPTPIPTTERATAMSLPPHAGIPTSRPDTPFSASPKPVPLVSSTEVPKPFPPFFPIPIPSVYPPTLSVLSPEDCATAYQTPIDFVSKNDILQGYIFDDNAQLMEDVQVTAEFNNASLSYYSELKTKRGYYQFPCAAAGISVKITVQKSGFTTRSREEIIKGNRGQPNYNRYDFGSDTNPFTEDFSASYEGLSDKPEITWVTPARNGVGVSPQTGFTFQFSEPMERSSVEKSLTIRTFKVVKLSADKSIHTFPEQPGFTPTFKGTARLDTNLQADQASAIMDASCFDIYWNEDDTQVHFQPKPGWILPTDKNPALLPIYQIAFVNFQGEKSVLRDKTGVGRQDLHFKLTSGSPELSIKFIPKPDQTPPLLQDMHWLGIEPMLPVLLLSFNEPLLIHTLAKDIAGGMSDEAESCKQAPAAYPAAKLCSAQKAAENYQVKVTSPKGTVSYQGTWEDLGGEANYASGDASFRTIVLSSNSFHPAFVSGAQVEIAANPDIVDPAGNPMSNSQTSLKVLIP